VEMLPEGNQQIGRSSYSALPFLRAALAKRYFKIVATSDLRARLLSDAKSISQFVLDRGRIPIIDQNKRRKTYERLLMKRPRNTIRSAQS